MDFDLFLTSPRWEILQIIAEKPSSPIEIAEKINTTVSYVSQQLKLLDAAGLLDKEKTGAAEKGKPRSLFSISKELLYLTTLTADFSKKKLVYLTNHHKGFVKIWMSTDVIYHQSLEKIYFKVEEDLNEVDGMFLEISSIIPKVIIISESKKLKSKIDSIIDHLNQKIDCVFLSKNQLKKFSVEYLIALHDPNKLLDEMKGGNLNKEL